MKKIKIVIAATITLCLVQGAWAVSPGGAIDGGGKSAQHPQQASTAAPVESARPSEVEILDMEAVNTAPITEEITTAQPATAANSTLGSPATHTLDETAATKTVAAPASKKEMRQELKSALKAHRDSAKPSAPQEGDKLLCVIVALFIPWLGVALYMGGITTEFWICLLLWFLFILPGLIYALWVILR